MCTAQSKLKLEQWLGERQGEHKGAECQDDGAVVGQQPRQFVSPYGDHRAENHGSHDRERCRLPADAFGFVGFAGAERLSDQRCARLRISLARDPGESEQRNPNCVCGDGQRSVVVPKHPDVTQHRGVHDEPFGDPRDRDAHNVPGVSVECDDVAKANGQGRSLVRFTQCKHQQKQPHQLGDQRREARPHEFKTWEAQVAEDQDAVEGQLKDHDHHGDSHRQTHFAIRTKPTFDHQRHRHQD